MKKILLLGGSAQQVVAIETAKRLGFYTVLCDYLPDNPGQYVADRFYLVSTTDKAAILEVAQQEHIDGVLAYASDPAAPTAAYVAEQMGLPTNPYESVEILCNKDRFREFLRTHDFHTPKSQGFCTFAEADASKEAYHLPVIVKPVDSSGSKGATVLYAWDTLQEAVDFALSFSRSGRFIVEEFIEKGYPYVIGGDVFVKDGTVVIWGLMNCHRDSHVNPLVPVGKSYPLNLSEAVYQEVQHTIQRVIQELNIQYGAVNVELIVDTAGRVWPIDFGPRCGGNMIPDLLGHIFCVDIVEMSVLAAMGDTFAVSPSVSEYFYASHNIHSEVSGLFERIELSDLAKKCLLEQHIYKRENDPVEFFDNASKALGILFFRFETKEDLHAVIDHITEHVRVIVK